MCMTTTSKQIAETIIDQAGRFTLASMGARDFLNLGYTDRHGANTRGGVQFRVGSGRRLRKIIVTLNDWDLYDVECVTINRKTGAVTVGKAYRNIDCEQLPVAVDRAFVLTEG